VAKKALRYRITEKSAGYVAPDVRQPPRLSPSDPPVQARTARVSMSGRVLSTNTVKPRMWRLATAGCRLGAAKRLAQS
jgi:hypothetical protein